MKLIVANLKLNFTLPEMIVYKKRLDEFITGNPEVVICPQYPYLSLFNEGNYNLGAQDVSRYIKGAYTGEVSAADLNSLDVDYVIIGHSERRTLFKENEDMFLNKINTVLEHQMSPIYCVGETSEERSRKKTIQIIQKQISAIFNKMSETKINNIIIAYEPVWAIGSGKVPTNAEIEEVITFIKSFVLSNYRVDIKVIYGGSVNDFNIEQLMLINSCDGFLVGSAALNIEEFKSIVNRCEEKKEY